MIIFKLLFYFIVEHTLKGNYILWKNELIGVGYLYTFKQLSLFRLNYFYRRRYEITRSFAALLDAVLYWSIVINNLKTKHHYISKRVLSEVRFICLSLNLKILWKIHFASINKLNNYCLIFKINTKKNC